MGYFSDLEVRIQDDLQEAIHHGFETKEQFKNELQHIAKRYNVTYDEVFSIYEMIDFN